MNMGMILKDSIRARWNKLNYIFCNNRENCIYIFIFIVLFLSTIKYVSNGETYIFSTPWTGETIEINNNIVTQEIIIDKKAKWNKKSYAVYFEIPDLPDKQDIIEGYVEVSLVQDDKIVSSYSLLAARINTGINVLNGFNYSDLKSGRAVISLHGVDLDYPVQVGVCDNIYNLPNCMFNGTDTGKTLVQQYHLNFVNLFYKAKLFAFFLLVFFSVIGIYVCIGKDDNRYNSNKIRCILILIYMLLVFVYDSSLYFSPTWAESVTNFMHNAQNRSFCNNWLISDAGYLPLIQRIISQIIYKVLKCSPYVGLYVMQITAYFISALIFSFFVKYQFHNYLTLKYRYLLSLLFMIQVINKETGAFINFINYGVFIVFLYFLVDSSKWSKKEFVTLCLFGCTICLSKGIYVTLLPFLIVCFLLFYKNYNRRDVIFTISCMVGALLQLIYYLNNGSNWVDRSNSSNQEYYYLKLILEVLVDTPNNILGFFFNDVTFFNGVSIIIIISFWITIIYFFWIKIFVGFIQKRKIQKFYQLFYMMIIYIMAQSLFLRLTLFGTNMSDILSDDFWIFSNYRMDGRHHISIFFAVSILVLIIIYRLSEIKAHKVSIYAIYILIIFMMISSPRFQLKGIGDDSYGNWQTSLSNLTAEVTLFKKLQTSECMCIPIQPNKWIYNKNANIYSLGVDIFEWNTLNIKSDEPKTGNIYIGNYSNIDKKCGIYQIFIKKSNLIDRKNYQVLLYDADGNILLRQIQDNTNYQLITSFTFDCPVNDVANILIVDSEGNSVFLENSIYIVTN